MVKAQRMVAIAALSLALGPVSACSQSTDESRSTRRAIAQSQAIAADFARTELALSPESASRLDLERIVGPTASFALDNHSQSGFERKRLVRIELLQRLQSRPRLDAAHPLTRDLGVAERALVDLISLEQLGYGRFNYAALRPYAIDPYSGIWIEGPVLLAYRQSITTTEQATAYLMRLRALSAAVQDTKRRLIADDASGITLPAVLAEETSLRISRMLETDGPGLDRLIETFSALTSDVSDMPIDQREQLTQLVRAEVTDKLRPAYLDLVETLDRMADASVEQTGIWGQPRGFDMYRGVLAAAVGEPIETERLHQTHLEAVARDANALEQLMRIDLEPERSIDPKPDRLEQQFDWFQTIHSVEDPASINAPQLDPPLDIILRLAPATDWQRIGRATSFSPQADAIQRFEAQFSAAPFTTWRTEAESSSAPYRQILEYPAIQSAWNHYVWAQSSKHLDVDLQPVSALAHQTISLTQSVLAAADTGLHLQRWSLAEATDFIALYAGLTEPLARQLALSIASRPGHHSAVATARQRMEGLATRSRAVLGEQYSETEFQRTLIGPGPRPLSLIERDIETWYGARLQTATD
ncbi:MAG: DUF885 family protein [Pseudomonadota bacterium]